MKSENNNFLLFINKAKELGYSVEIISSEKQVAKLVKDGKERFVVGPLMPLNTTVSARISKDKDLTKVILKQKDINIPFGVVFDEWEKVLNAIESKKIKYPLVVKPNNAALGAFVSVDIKKEEDLKRAFEWVQEKYQEVLIEEFLPWNDYRFFVVDGKFLAAAQRIQPYVTGDGIKTLGELINALNETKGEKKVVVDMEAQRYLKEQGYSQDDVVSDGVKVVIRGNANIQTGGFIVDVTDEVAQKFIDIAIKCARILNMRLAGVDILCEDITNPDSPYAITEVNALPSYPYVHDHPDIGRPRDPVIQVLEATFKDLF